ncbi:predicted protein [Sclerotinia sclerotiorum 1980 UF-70]|uniref:Myb-like domain-containing protein n=2 Tax=Sclerotinia sclerotiorum (strain ATCC 18683 / 1980 / Ss-1) TaxID=665079 RepID=A7E9F9_SCLS1|nr:predicted protein [Sclerotinia sclerotiorum 1980 UF-70]APA05719.1 hypothetical protein sscle_01g004890 [Sclerotinia sclerotiorum 1980 UF-70]EDN97011.1 predicted protein [Sclerotinia sclerotiorum 1980 UF-70]
MSNRSESQKRAAETAQAVPRAKGKAAAGNPSEVPESIGANAGGMGPFSRSRWTQKERDYLLLQICLQAGGKGFAPKWEAIDVPGRTEKALQNIWGDIKKSAAEPIAHAGESKEDDDSNDNGNNAAEKAGEGAIQKKPKVAKKVAVKAKANEAKGDAKQKLVVDDAG